MAKKHTSLNKEKQHEILVTDPEAHAKVKGFVGDKHPERPPMMRDSYGRMVVHDDGVANEINERFGTKSKGGTGEVTVVTVDDPGEPGHNYTFSVPSLPWKKEKEDASKDSEAETRSRRRTSTETEGSEAKDVQGDVDARVREDGEQAKKEEVDAV